MHVPSFGIYYSSFHYVITINHKSVIPPPNMPEKTLIQEKKSVHDCVNGAVNLPFTKFWGELAEKWLTASRTHATGVLGVKWCNTRSIIAWSMTSFSCLATVESAPICCSSWESSSTNWPRAWWHRQRLLATGNWKVTLNVNRYGQCQLKYK